MDKVYHHHTLYACIRMANASLNLPARPYVWGLTPDAGPVSGGTIVTVHGENFRNTSFVKCMFGSLWVDGVFGVVPDSGEMTITCVTPPIDMPEELPVEIALDEAETFTRNGVLFDYYLPTIDSVTPTRFESILSVVPPPTQP